MTAGHDDLTRPLGLERAPAKRARSLPLGQVFVAVVGLIFMALAAFLVLVKDPFGGEPHAIVAIDRSPKPQPQPSPGPGPTVTTTEPGTTPSGGERSMADVEQDTGVRVVRGSGQQNPGGVLISVPGAGIRLVPSPDKRLVERSRHGPLPRIGADGARPAEVYARPAPPVRNSGRIAIVVGGMGLSPSLTNDAVVKLAPEISLAFAPYGAELERQVSRARESGHEVLLQVPMEPFDYPDNDPGPHTLLAAAQPNDLFDRLYWVMSRFSGYVGIVNYMGAKFTASEAAVGTLAKELAARGLVMLDDGSSPRSVVSTVAPVQRLPFARADVVIDAVPRGTAIDDQLARLETLAKERGLAIGMASALPVSLDRLVQWSKTLEAKGIVLVPVSAAIAKPGRG